MGPWANIFECRVDDEVTEDPAAFLAAADLPSLFSTTRRSKSRIMWRSPARNSSPSTSCWT